MSRRPTAKAGTFLAVGVLLIVVGSTAQAGWLFVLAAAVLGPAAASPLLAPRLRHCLPTRAVADRAAVGETVRTAVTLHNAGTKYVPLVRVRDEFPATNTTAVLCRGLAPGNEATAQHEAPATHRGRFESGPVTLSSSWPFGLLRTTRTVHVCSRLVVVPRWVQLDGFAPLDASRGGFDRARVVQRAGNGEQLAGVREYRTGDELRRVHWRSTARFNRLVIRDYEDETSRRVAIVLTGGDHGTPPDSAFEALVSAAASVALYAMRCGHEVDFVRAARVGVERLSGGSPDELLDWLADAAPEDAPLPPLLDVVDQAAGGTTVIVFTPACGVAARTLAAAGAAVDAAAVVADSSTWDDAARADVNPKDMSLVPIRWLRRGEDLKACLER